MRLLKNASLYTTVLLLVVGTLCCLIFLVLASVVWVTRHETQRAQSRDFHATDAIFRQVLDVRAESIVNQCEALARNTAGLTGFVLGGGQDALTWETVSDVAEDLRHHLDADMVLITNRTGHALGKAPHTSRDAGASFATDPSVASSLDGKPWKGLLTRDGRLTLAVSIPISTPGQPYVQGTLCTFTDVGRRLPAELGKALDCEVVFVAHGRVVGDSTPLRSLPDLPSLRDGESTALPSAIESGGRRYLASYQMLRLNPQSEGVGILILHRFDAATALQRNLETGLIGPVALSLLFAFLAGSAVARRITRPLEGVVHAAHEIREGRWPERLPVENDDEIGLLQTVFNEMTVSLRSAQERLMALIDSDPLTELDNHRRFQDRLAKEMHRAEASGEPLSLLILDIDHFQAFNQQHGHRQGDDVLKGLAELVQSVVPPFSLTARYGGEEIAVLTPRLAGDETARFAESLCAAVQDSALGVTVSAGYAERGNGTAEPESLTLAAELALTQAKQLGRNRAIGFDAVAGVATRGDLTTRDPFQLHRFLRDGSLATIQALAAAVDAKDPYTQGHSRRVADLALRMAKRCKLPAEVADLILTTGTLHDVGKIGVPDSVLQKAGRLDSDERRLMETHPVLGEVIVGKVPQLAQTLPGIRSHHERWDGAGYPDGLAGEQIPLVARVLALADTFDAMTSNRTYRQGLAHEIALGEIERCAGTQFDPDLAPIFVALLRE
jgi:diguanylate cyclase (GGDEF)-like protein